MYENDSRTGTDYEYNHSLDAYMQQSYKMPYQPKSLGESLAILREPKLLVKQKSFFVITKLQKAVDSIRSDEKSKLC